MTNSLPLPAGAAFALTLLLVSFAHASECYDHYNHSAWNGQGLAMVLCRNNSDSTRDNYITSCEIRQHGGAALQPLVRHGSLDNGRLVYADYDTTGASFAFDIDILCHDKVGTAYTFFVGNGAQWHDGCCRNVTCGSVSCCGTDCSSSQPDAGTTPGPDAGDPDTALPCPPLPSDQHDDPRVILNVGLGSPQRLSFTVGNVPAPGGLDYAELTMRLYDADHPGQEGTVFVNGNGPISLPAAQAWNDVEADAALSVPVSHLQAGQNLVEFGAGTLATTYYGVSRVALNVYGPACELDAARPDGFPADAENEPWPSSESGSEGSTPVGDASKDVDAEGSRDAAGGGTGGVSAGSATDGADSGCACATAPSPSAPPAWTWLSVLALGFSVRRARHRSISCPT
jgi:MYXO-CTERM domain-containing protein